MNKPTKKGFLVGKNTGDKNWEISVCNKSCDEWEKFLPDEAEILLILTKAFKVFKSGKGKFNSYEYTVSEMIAKRIGK